MHSTFDCFYWYWLLYQGVYLLKTISLSSFFFVIIILFLISQQKFTSLVKQCERFTIFTLNTFLSSVCGPWRCKICYGLFLNRLQNINALSKMKRFIFCWDDGLYLPARCHTFPTDNNYYTVLKSYEASLFELTYHIYQDKNCLFKPDARFDFKRLTSDSWIRKCKKNKNK